MEQFSSSPFDGRNTSSSTDKNSSSHPARRRGLRFGNISEEEFLRGSRIPRLKDTYLGRKELSPYHPSDSGKQFMEERRQKYQQTFEKANTSLQVCFENLSNTLSSYTSCERKVTNIASISEDDSNFPTMEELREIHGQTRSLWDNLDSLAQTCNISDGDVKTFADAQIQSIKEVIRTMKIMGASNVKAMEQNLQLHENSYESLLDENSPVSDLSALKTDIKKLSDQVFDEAKRKITWDTLLHITGSFKWIDTKPQESALSLLRESPEYITLKESFSELKQLYEEMRNFDEKKSDHNENDQEAADQQAQLLRRAARAHREFFKKYQIFKEAHLLNPQPSIMAEWRQEGKGIFEHARAKSIERRLKGMSESVTEQSWKSFYDYGITRIEQGIWRPPNFDTLMKEGLLKGTEGDYYIVWMRPKHPYNPQQNFTEMSYPLVVCVNPKEGVLVNSQADRETEKRWRDTVFPKEFARGWVKQTKQILGIQTPLPEDFFKPLHASELSVLAYQVAQEMYEGKKSYVAMPNTQWLPSPPRDSGERSLLSKSDLSPVPLTEIVGTRIAHPESEAKLLKYSEVGEMIIFHRGEEGFDLVLATHLGRRGPFMQAAYPEIVGNGEINRVGIYREPDSRELDIKIFIDQENESGT